MFRRIAASCWSSTRPQGYAQPRVIDARISASHRPAASAIPAAFSSDGAVARVIEPAIQRFLQLLAIDGLG